LNHFTVPVAMDLLPLLMVAANPGATKPGMTIIQGIWLPLRRLVEEAMRSWCKFAA
jgi:hypothetical protein